MPDTGYRPVIMGVKLKRANKESDCFYGRTPIGYFEIGYDGTGYRAVWCVGDKRIEHPVRLRALTKYYKSIPEVEKQLNKRLTALQQAFKETSK